MLGVVLFALVAVTGASVVAALLRVDEDHALAGLLGDPARELVIAKRAARLLHGAESVVRLAEFTGALAGHAWNGMPLVISRRSARWSEWSFADGSRWMVRHERRPPKQRRRMIVASATSTRRGLAVDAYGAGGACPEEVVVVTDAVAAGFGGPRGRP